MANTKEMLQRIRAQWAQAFTLSAGAIYSQIKELETQVIDGTLNDKRASVAIASLKWRASKMNPDRFSDRTNIDHTGSVASSVSIIDYSSHAPIKVDSNAIPTQPSKPSNNKE